jgi:signal transduction histidine kinase
VRARLTLWYTAALACVLAAYAGTVFVFLRHTLYADLDRRLRDDIELIHEALEATDDGRLVWRVAGHSGEADEVGRPGHRWLEVWSREGRLLLRTAAAEPLGLGAPSPGSKSDPVSLHHGGHGLRVLTAPEEIAGVPVFVRTARSEEPLRHELRELLFVQGVGLPVALALASIGGYQLARRALGPVGRMTESARRISAERLNERLPLGNPADELGHLAAVFNDAFARLERSFEQMRRFTADASHELRTPLTALRSPPVPTMRETGGLVGLV